MRITADEHDEIVRLYRDGQRTAEIRMTAWPLPSDHSYALSRNQRQEKPR